MAEQVITFGCRLNTFESEVIQDHLNAHNMKDVVVVNTCAVTKEAERQARQTIRKLHREQPNRPIVVTGCSAQITPDKYAAMPGVTKVLGNQEKMQKESFSADELIHDTEPLKVNDIMAVEDTAHHMVTSFDGRSRAFLQVQNGCNHRCTFCIIPYGRGNSRSVPIGEIAKHAQLLVNEGYQEVVLTGVDVTDYGLDLPGKPTLGQMIRRVLALVPDLKRVRLSSIDVAEIDDDLWHLIAEEPRLMPHLHVSLQAGDNMVLKRMKRRHTREQVIEFCQKARELRPDIVFGADIIAGFPTESDEMFENTLKLIEETGLIHLHIFPYSEREGTPAASIPQNKQVPKPIRKSRAAALREAGNTELRKALEACVGKELSAIVEQNGMARTDQFFLVKTSQDLPAGSLKTFTIKGVEGEHLIAA